LSASERCFFERQFGYDFSPVRSHVNALAAESALALNARACTLGEHVVFGAGQYATETYEGRKILAHELAHLVQQNNALAHPGSAPVLQRKCARSVEGGTPIVTTTFY
jgi:Domain of unknown function (DUF4157)